MKVKCNCCGHIYDINATPVKDEKASVASPKPKKKEKKTISYYKREKKRAYQRAYYRKNKAKRDAAALALLTGKPIKDAEPTKDHTESW